MFRPVLATVAMLATLGVAAGQESPFGMPKPMGGPIVGTDGRIRTGLDAHPVASPWDGGIELGVSGATGNTSTLTLRTGFDVRYDDPDIFMIFNVLYFLNQVNQGEVENQGFALYRNELPIDGGIGWYAQAALEYDEFRTIYLRASSHSGLTYTFLQDANQLLKFRAGAGVAREWGGPSPSDWVPEGQAGFDYEYRLTTRTKFVSAVDYYPDLNDFNHYRVRVRASFDILLDPTANIYLRLGAFDRYDSNPYGSKRNDLTYWMMLQFKF
jgi:Protein of unknown function, DUF481